MEVEAPLIIRQSETLRVRGKKKQLAGFHGSTAERIVHLEVDSCRGRRELGSEKRTGLVE